MKNDDVHEAARLLVVIALVVAFEAATPYVALGDQDGPGREEHRLAGLGSSLGLGLALGGGILRRTRRAQRQAQTQQAAENGAGR